MNLRPLTAGWIIVAVIVVAVVAVWLIDSNSRDKQVQTNSTTTAADSSNSSNPQTSTTPPTAGQNTSPTSPPTSTFGEAINTYDYRIQFSDCTGVIVPGTGTLAMKKGTKLMLDNRDPEPHTIRFNGRSYSLRAYGFTVVTADTVGNFTVTCDGGGAAQLKIQA